LSHCANAAYSFKSVCSYVLGDLEISSQSGDNSLSCASFEKKEELLGNSFEISSNSSKGFDLSPDKSKAVIEQVDNYNAMQDIQKFGGFIAQQSPLSFKNPIFFSCPSNKNFLSAGNKQVMP